MIKKLLILCIDDDNILTTVIERKFQESGIDALFFNSPYDYENALFKKPDIAVIDFVYSGYPLNGLDLMRKTKEAHQECEIIIISSISDPKTLRQLAPARAIIDKCEQAWLSQLVTEVLSTTRALSVITKKPNRLKALFIIIVDFFIKHFVTK